MLKSVPITVLYNPLGQNSTVRENCEYDEGRAETFICYN